MKNRNVKLLISGRSLLLCLLLVAAGAPAVWPSNSEANIVLDRAKKHLPVLRQAIDDYWPNVPTKEIMAGQVEQESTWEEKATLKTSRELGRGLVQLTIAYGKDGKERFNSFRGAMGYKALRGWDWENDPYNVRFQLMFLVLHDRDNFSQVRRYCISDAEAWKCALIWYNAGKGRWLARRIYAKLARLPPDRWTDGLELAHGPKEDVILYGRPLWQAVNEYPRVILKRAVKYKGLI